QKAQVAVRLADEGDRRRGQEAAGGAAGAENRPRDVGDRRGTIRACEPATYLFPRLCLGTRCARGSASLHSRSPMTRTRYRFFESEYPCFMTSTIVAWLPFLCRPIR